MNALRDLDQAEVVAAAEAALRLRGAPVRIRDIQALGNAERRNLILRGIAQNGEDRAIIIKATRAGDYDPAAADAFDESGLVKEWVATAFLAAHAPAGRHGAALLAGDAARGILIFEDLGAGLTSLVDPLLHGDAEAAERALTAYASALGRLHADTFDVIGQHCEVLQTLFPAARRRASSHRARFEGNAAKVCTHVGGVVPHGEIAQIAQRLDAPGPWYGLVHGDPCPDNALLRGGRIHLIDHEFAMPGHVLCDAVYWRIGFPTCWCAGRVPAPVAARAEAVYRGEIGAVRAVDEAAFGRELAFMAAVWMLRRLALQLENALNEDRVWGIAPVRSRLLWYLEASVAMSEAADVLPGLRATARGWLERLRERWPEAVVLGLYPAFSGQR
jgi:Phosphotransferase enzyme family